MYATEHQLGPAHSAVVIAPYAHHRHPLSRRTAKTKPVPESAQERPGIGALELLSSFPKAVPAELEVHCIVDNYVTHSLPEVKA